jgi:hypothetical protein
LIEKKLSLLSSSSALKVSSSHFDKLITDYDNPKANITFTSDVGIKMDINIEIDKKNDVLTYVDFYYNNTKIYYGNLDPRQLTLLVDGYRQHVTKLAKDRSAASAITLSWSTLKDPKSLIKIFSKIAKIKKVLRRYHDIRLVNVFTIIKDDASHNQKNNKILARTTIELDADIITIIPPELLLQNTNETSFLFSLHSANIHLANYLFLYPIMRIFVIVKLAKYILRILSIPLWIAFSIFIFPKGVGVFYEYIFSIVNFIGIPALLFRLVPKIMSYIIKKKLT